MNRTGLLQALQTVPTTGSAPTSVKRFVDLLIDGVSGDTPVLAEIPGGAINGSNKNFTTAVDFSQIWVWLNGVRQNPNPSGDYTVTGANTFQMTNAPQTGDVLLVDYIAA